MASQKQRVLSQAAQMEKEQFQRILQVRRAISLSTCAPLFWGGTSLLGWQGCIVDAVACSPRLSPSFHLELPRLWCSCIITRRIFSHHISTHLPIHLSISTHLAIHLSISIHLHLAIHLSISTHLPMHLSIFGLHVCMCIHVSYNRGAAYISIYILKTYLKYVHVQDLPLVSTSSRLPCSGAAYISIYILKTYLESRLTE